MLTGNRHRTCLLLASLLSLLCMATGAQAAPKPSITSTSPLPAGVVAYAYSFTFTATSGVPPYQNWTVTAGALPPGLALAPATGVLSGTPTAAGTFSFTVTVQDSATPPKTSNAVNFSLTIAPPSCTFVGGISTGSIAFANIDPSSAGNLYGTVTQQVSFTCNVNPMAYTISFVPNSGWLLQSGANTMAYTPGIAASGTYSGAAVNLLLPPGVGGTSVAQGDYQNAPAGLYASTATVTITVSWVLGGGGSIVATVPAGNVTGTVINNCVVTQAAGTLAFAVNPSAASATAALSPVGQDLKIKCTKNDPVTVTAASKCAGLAQDGSGPCSGFLIPYTFNYLTSATGLGFGTGLDIPLGIGGSATQANYANAPAGSGYGDIQTLTITY